MEYMPIQQRHIEELKRIYQKHFSEGLSDKDAWAMAHRLENLYRLLLKREQEREKKA